MEKYRRFEDRATGVPVYVVRQPRFSLVAALAGLLLVPLRLSILLLILPLFLFVTLISTILSPLASLRRLADLFLVASLWRLALTLFGFYGIVNKSYVLRQEKAKRDELSKVEVFQHGDVLLCNSTSYVDILVLAAFVYPTFTELVMKGKDGGIVLCSFCCCCNLIQSLEEPTYRKISALKALRNGLSSLHRGQAAGKMPFLIAILYLIRGLQKRRKATRCSRSALKPLLLAVALLSSFLRVLPLMARAF